MGVPRGNGSGQGRPSSALPSGRSALLGGRRGLQQRRLAASLPFQPQRSVLANAKTKLKTAIISVVLIMLSGTAFNVFPQCPADSFSAGLTSAQKIQKLKEVKVESLDESCVIAILGKFNKENNKTVAEQVIGLVNRWVEKKPLTLALFYNCAAMAAVQGGRETGAGVLALWKGNGRDIHHLPVQFSRTGQQAQADSLWRALDRCAPLNMQKLLEWARVREVLGAYNGSVELYCRALHADPRALDLVYGRLYQLFENASTDTVAAALGPFERCVFDLAEIDTLGVQLWLADFYGRRSMDAQEMNVLGLFGASSQQLFPRLMDMARVRYIRGFYAKAIVPAQVAYRRAASPQAKTTAAGMLYQAYRALGRNDSALLWLKRADLSSEKGRIDAVVLYQCAGALSEAQKILQGLPTSFVRDTLEVRQRLFAGDTKEAADLVLRGGKRWSDRPSDWILWKARTLLFDNRTGALSALMDSVKIDPSWKQSGEILDYRYRLQLFGRSGGARAVWCGIEYDCYTGHPQRAEKRLAQASAPADFKQELALRIIREYCAQGNRTAAAEFFRGQGSFSGADSPEYLFLFARTLLESGQTAASRDLLLRLIRDFPDDVFSEKARILLARLK